jgi:hypothetical protein
MKRENFLKLGASARIATLGGALAGTVVGWNRLALQAVRNAQPGAPRAARELAVLHTCMYNAWAAYDDAARQTVHGVAVRLPCSERSPASKARAISHAAYIVLRDRFPAQQAAFDAWMGGRGLAPAASGGPLSPAGIGRSQAVAMLDFCHRDGAGQLGGLVGLAGHGASALQQDGPQARALIIEPAPCRWYLPAQRLSERDGHDDDQDVRLFLALANALADAAVHGCVGAAAIEVIRRFGGERPGRTGGDTRLGAAGAAGQELGRQVGARAFDGARRYWDGKL